MLVLPGILPSPYPDELAYSVQSRYASILGAAAYIINCHLFARRKQECGPLRPMYPTVSVFERGDATERHEHVAEWLHAQTNWPYVARFLKPTSLRKSWRGYVSPSSTSGNDPVSFGPLTSQFLRYCPCCARVDTERYGEPYWHRVHNLPAVHACPTHEEPLWAFPDSGSRSSRAYQPLSDVRGVQKLVIGVDGKFHMRLATTSARWLAQPIFGFEGRRAACVYCALLDDSKRAGEAGAATAMRP